VRNQPAPSGQPARCGFDPRQPLLMISPYSRRNFVDGTTTSQSSVPKFIEDNWLAGQRIGGGSNDAITGTLTNMLNFNQQPGDRRLFLDPITGQPKNPGDGAHHTPPLRPTRH
jgi:phospholipase C